MIALGVLMAVAACANHLSVSDARVCSDVIVRNGVHQLRAALDNCTIVTGQLQIALMTKTTTKDFQGVSFPALRKIWGLFLMFNIRGLQYLGAMFPNLEIVIGGNVFPNYTFILYHLPDLKEVSIEYLRLYLLISKCVISNKVVCWLINSSISLLTRKTLHAVMPTMPLNILLGCGRRAGRMRSG